MKTKCFYKLLNKWNFKDFKPGLYIYIDAKLAGDKYLVSWWRTDDRTGKRIDMATPQELNIPPKDYGDWELVEDSIEKKVMRHWRQG